MHFFLFLLGSMYNFVGAKPIKKKQSFNKTTMKKLNLSCILVLVMCATICCTHDNSYYKVDESRTIVISDTVDTIMGMCVYRFDSPHNLVGIESVDSFVVLLTEHQDSLFLVMNTNTDTVIGALGTIGKAKNEMIVPMRECQFGKAADGDVLMYIDDFNRQSVLTFNFSESLTNNHLVYVTEKPYRLINQAEQYAFFSVSDNEYVMFQGIAWENGAQDNRTIPPFVSKSTDTNNKCVLYPQMIEGEDFQKNFIYNLMAKIKPDQSKLLLAHGNIGQFTIVDLDSWTTIGVHDKNSYDFGYLSELVTEDRKSFFSKLKAYYTSCNVTDDYILLSRDGNHSMSEFEQMEHFQPMICLFDWSGNLISSFIVHEEIGPITLDSHNKCLYGVGADNCVYKYDLSKMI